MKIRVTMKDPDAPLDAISEAVKNSLSGSGLSKSELEKVEQIRANQVGDALHKWIRHGEYLTVEFDTDAGTATVIEAQR